MDPRFDVINSGGNEIFRVVFFVEDLPDLRQALLQLHEREVKGEANYPLCCCLLWVGQRGLDGAIGRYLTEAPAALDALTADDCLVFIVESNKDRPDPLMDAHVVEVARYLDVRLDSLPCCVFFTPSNDAKTLIVRLARFIPKGPGGYNLGDVAVAFRAIAEATRVCRDEPTEGRLALLRATLTEAHHRSFPEDTAVGESHTELRSNLTAAASVVSALTSVAKIFAGG